MARRRKYKLARRRPYGDRQKFILRYSGPARHNKYIRRSRYVRKSRPSMAMLSNNVSRFFKVPPREMPAVLKSTNVIMRLYEAGGTGATKGFAFLQFNPCPVPGKQLSALNNYADGAVTAQTFGITQFFNAYTFCFPYGMKVSAQITNHSSANSVTIVILPIVKPTDMWDGITINHLITRPEAKSFILGVNGQSTDHKSIKIMLRTKDFQQRDLGDFAFDSRGKDNEDIDADDAPNPFVFVIYALSNPLMNSDKVRNAVHVDIKAKIKYYTRFTVRKPTNPF